VRAWDPLAKPGELLRAVTICDSVLEAVEGADAAVIVTEWDELRSFPTREIFEAMRTPVVIDGRNLLDPETVRAAGFVYEGIGRASSPLGFELRPAADRERELQQ
jgi:UDPglucose 6-dehydrogenase